MSRLLQRSVFNIKKRLWGDAYLSELSISAEALHAKIAGKKVALIGNARALSQSACGAMIDACDLVIRLNDAPLPATISHGSRTDWIAAAKTLKAETLAARAPDTILWMPQKRKRLSYDMVAHQDFYLNNPVHNRRLFETLGAPPTVGMMLVDLLHRSDASAINLFGFDFFISRSLSGRRSAAEVPHDFAAEKKLLQEISLKDTRLKVW